MKFSARHPAAITSRIEIALLLIWIGLAGAVWVFLKLADEVIEGDLDRFDQSILYAFRVAGDPHQAAGPHWLLESMRDITALGGLTLLSFVTVLGVIVLWAHRQRRQAVIFGICVPLAQLSSGLFKDIYERARPSFAIYGDLPTSMSFPSGHSTVATATYFLLAVIVASLEPRRAMKALAFSVAALLALLIGVSRVYLGVHWPSDVLAGWSLGAAWALFAAILLRMSARLR
ncbi:undecaprenyl-diphosphatase [Rhizomicrobium palustre]|uniref:Undecaprenyl-diphosphatase n=1 Tax=Rhizomicrobium palustre TaxID=189966 RepID=A0A846N0R2_9PROT|nr:phosphatase PAP2 family protein [Rhizomicrobium palustre]NIK88757.1 undecaprenyl-diphosphatase [Rhizomicrobium palustre]